MTTKQKQNIARFKAVQAEAKKLKAKNKNLTHIQAVKQAWAITLGKEKKSPVKKVGAVKKKVVKKKAIKKKPSVIKFNTKNIAGTLKLSPEEKRLGMKPITDKDIFKGIQTDKNYFKKQIQENIQLMAKFANAIIYSQNAIKQNIYDWEKKEYRKVIKEYKDMIRELKLHNKELFKLIK